ncbi:isochorismate synthase [Nevskia sp.]|uniref:isochorismate synthase n=1 Tax=Nevskia sp. TaxID=1929292 RepID=UPI0025E1545C|nr:isochorismate synthase [Nevskia sp.]
MDNALEARVAAPQDLSANALLLRYAARSSFFFASPQITVLGEGIQHRLPEASTAGAPLATRVQALFDQACRAGRVQSLVVGALPFASDAEPVLYIPAQIERAGPLSCARLPLPRPAARHCIIQERPRADRYRDSVVAALQRFKDTPLQKVVLSRSLELLGDSDIDQPQLLRNLAQRNATGFTYAVDLPVAVRGASPRRLMGASPELLLSRRGERVISNPIAGSLPRSADPEQDRANAASLLASAKDHHEHALVVDAVVAALRPYCKLVERPPMPSLTSTARLWHLSTRVVGVLRDPSVSSLTLAQALHPTPAVCGHPQQLAREAIAALEPLPRGLFTGMVGWCDASGDGEWAITIRCAEVEAGRARLYAGAGIVPASDPQLEVAETATKFRTMLDAFGASIDTGAFA